MSKILVKRTCSDTVQHNIMIKFEEMIKNPVSLQCKIGTHNKNSVVETLRARSRTQEPNYSRCSTAAGFKIEVRGVAVPVAVPHLLWRYEEAETTYRSNIEAASTFHREFEDRILDANERVKHLSEKIAMSVLEVQKWQLELR